MKEELQTNKKGILKEKRSTRSRQKLVVQVRAKAPACKSCELPILKILSREPETGMRAKVVIQEVSSAKWFPLLDEDDQDARYVSSRKKITPTVIRWARENLALQGEICGIGNGGEVGVWKATMKGLDRAKEGVDGWRAEYSVHDVILLQIDGVEDES